MHTVKWINEHRVNFSSCFSFSYFPVNNTTNSLVGEDLFVSSTEFKEKNCLHDSFWNRLPFLSSAPKLKEECTFMAEPYLLLFTFSTFSLQLRIWNPQNATIATEWQLAFKQPPTFEAVVLTFAHPIFIWGIFQTPERRIESEITTEEHATSCEMLSLTCFWGNKQTKSVL